MIKKKEIKIEKDFLMAILKSVEDLKEEIDLLKQNNSKPEIPLVKNVPVKQDYIFQCVETQSADKIPLPSEMLFYKQKSIEFRKEIETLMKKHKIIQVMASFLKKL